MYADVCSRIDHNVAKAVEVLYSYIRIDNQKGFPDASLSNLTRNTHENLEDLINNFALRRSPGVFLTTCKIHHFLWTFIPPIVFLLGSLGNTLAFLVLRHPATRHVSVFVYLTARSVVDEIVLIVGLLRRWIDYLIGAKLENTSALICKLAQFLGTSSSLLSVWLTVLLTAERALVITFPLQGNRFVTFAKVRRAILLLSFICIAISSHFFFTVELVNGNSQKGESETCISRVESNGSVNWEEGNQEILFNVTQIKGKPTKNFCNDHCSFREELAILSWLWPTVDATIYSYLPFCLIFGLNIVILHYVYAAHKEHYGIRALPARMKGGSWGVDNNLRQLTIMLLVVSFSFLATTLSIVVMKILTQVPAMKSLPSIQAKAAFQLADTVAELLMYINHAMNFYLFCATGKRFRSRLVFLLMKFKRRGVAWLCNQQSDLSTACNARCSQFSNSGQMLAQFARSEGAPRGSNNRKALALRRPITSPARILGDDKIIGATLMQTKPLSCANATYSAVPINADMVHLSATEVKYTPVCVIFPKSTVKHWTENTHRFCPMNITSNDV